MCNGCTNNQKLFLQCVVSKQELWTLLTRTADAAPTGSIDASPHIVTIPPSAFASAVGIIVFTTGRLGLSQLSGSTGSGILITRRLQQEHTTPTAWNHPVLHIYTPFPLSPHTARQ